MPTYVYRCTKGHTFELFHAISDESAKRCPRCRSGAKRVPAGGSGVLFKGSGFYATDYRSKSYQESAKQESAGSKPAESAGGAGAASSEAKPKPKPAPSESGAAKRGTEKSSRRSGGRRGN